MHRIRAGNFACRNDGRNAQIALRCRWRSYAYAFIGEVDMHGVFICGGMNGDGLMPISRQARMTRRAISPQPMSILRCGLFNNDQGLIKFNRLFVLHDYLGILPARGAVIGFMVFMASTISNVWPSFTVSPTLIKAAAPAGRQICGADHGRFNCAGVGGRISCRGFVWCVARCCGRCSFSDDHRRLNG